MRLPKLPGLPGLPPKPDEPSDIIKTVKSILRKAEAEVRAAKEELSDLSKKE